MYVSETQLRVRYADTDQMGVVYHANYATYFEVGRTESIRKLGFTYKDMESMGIEMPVVDWHGRFLRPAQYDDVLTIRTTLRNLPDNHKIIFYQEVLNEQMKLLMAGTVTLYFIEKSTKSRTSMPMALKEKLSPFFIS
jgi:acyl-CoA thioester hydrolase